MTNFLYKFLLNQNTTSLFGLKLTFLRAHYSNIKGHCPTQQMKPKKMKHDRIEYSLPQWMHIRNRVIEKERQKEKR